MMISGKTMPTPIEVIWAKLELLGKFPAHLRVSAEHPLDLYAELSDQGRVGLFVLCDVEPPLPPTYESVAVEIGKRTDSRWSVQLKLLRPELRAQFARLCDDIILSGNSGIRKERAGHYVLERLARWRRLLDLGADGLLSDTALRGLVAEVSFLNAAIPLYGASVTVNAWNGPFDAAQDFHLPDRRYEIKAVAPNAATVKISSIDQLDTTDSEIQLVVYMLRRVEIDSTGFFTLRSLVETVRHSLILTGHVLDEFEARLANTGYRDLDAYLKIAFRIVDIKNYLITDNFPKLVRSEVSAAITSANYDIQLSECEDYRVAPIGRV
jgi:hypothetical protein